MAKVDSSIEAENANWSFENIADQFDEHVTKSVPLYHEGHELICHLSDFFLPKHGVVTEIGTSTGTLAERFLKHHAQREDIRYIVLRYGNPRFAGAIGKKNKDTGGTNVEFEDEDPRINELFEVELAKRGAVSHQSEAFDD